MISVAHTFVSSPAYKTLIGSVKFPADLRETKQPEPEQNIIIKGLVIQGLKPGIQFVNN